MRKDAPLTANILVYDVGSTYTKVSAFSLRGGKLAFLRRGQSPTTLDDVMNGVSCARSSLEREGVRIDRDVRCYSTCSAAGGLRMVGLGFMPRVTAKAAKEVAMCAGARVLEVISHEVPPESRYEILREISPDIILLAGGTDGGDVDSALENAAIIADVGLKKGVVILACNKDAQARAERILMDAGLPCVRVANVMPTVHRLNIKPSREAIHAQFIKQITQAKGLDRLQEMLADGTVVPTPGAVLLASELLALGTFDVPGEDSVLIVDVGGATTDIHSALVSLEDLEDEHRGLVISNEKQFSYRTVEGNLGLRVSATGIMETVGPKAVLRHMRDTHGADIEAVDDYTRRLERQLDALPQREMEREMERALAVCSMEVALKRHAGYISQEYDPVMGTAPGTVVGRDLRSVRHVIGVGGIFAHADEGEALDVLRSAFKDPGISLFPEAPSFYVDRNYVLYALGILGKYHPEAVVDYMKHNIIHGKQEGGCDEKHKKDS